MPRLSNDAFLEKLSEMAKCATTTGVVSVSFKRYNEGYNCFPSKKEQTVNIANNKCLIRAVCKKAKASTIVNAKDVASFNTRISAVLRGSITYLERKQKKGKKASE
ncbi:hypothetical protein AV274_3826 [Blastocystis sp. ATCC 50177/Nand II]|uniref:Signal recognition particle 14 kDa protein n=1 Tax=Blastocystis sp. subtype 1 (strain ATCC 50177 / NandII) TaxID=478820 RepID=A0A196SBY1_BLAHN|nr:hypothetical protein AV274_3826 [Blastocystis sp. ATCC 50177/Nand II]